ncbi:HAD-IIIC family phosphatase [Streptomyces sp. NPDC048362]|uniref:HAD-IIIC family phosphatase n=1 Tax=Streptomyces sp. NPDC048362 TaxID=3365539 RepID=UPI00371A2D8C
MTGAIVKCLVWDLDDTLWQGTLLEDGRVTLPEEVRKVVLELDARGILQSVASRNEHEHAWAQLEEFGVAEYFVLPEIGWGAKSESVRAIAEKLKFAPHTIAFIDDRPAERAEVAFHLPEVRCYPAEQATELLDLPEFSPAVRTADSRKRRQMYQAGFRREAARAASTVPDVEFLRSLELELRIDRAEPEDISRVEELTLRTSQMNATGVHYSDRRLRELRADPAHEVLVAGMSDRFGPHGAVGVLLLERRPGRWHLKLLATSCRVVSYGAGRTILDWLIGQAAEAGVHLTADFLATDRNRMMEIAYRFAGFEESACACVVPAGEEEPAGEGVQVLHLVPQPQPDSPVMRLVCADLTVGG